MKKGLTEWYLFWTKGLNGRMELTRSVVTIQCCKAGP